MSFSNGDYFLAFIVVFSVIACLIGLYNIWFHPERGWGGGGHYGAVTHVGSLGHHHHDTIHHDYHDHHF